MDNNSSTILPPLGVFIVENDDENNFKDETDHLMDDTENDVVFTDEINFFHQLNYTLNKRLNLKSFEVHYTNEKIFLYDLIISQFKKVNIRTSIVIKKNLNVIIHFNGIQQMIFNVSDIFDTDMKLTSFKQLQQLIDKYSNIDEMNYLNEQQQSNKLQKETPLNADKSIDGLRNTIITNLKELKNAIKNHQNYRHFELDFLIEQIDFIRASGSCRQHQFSINTMINSFLLYSLMGDDYDTFRGEFMLQLPLPHTLHAMSTLDDQLLDINPHSLLVRKKSSYFSNTNPKRKFYENLVNLQIKEYYFNGRLTLKASNVNCPATSMLCFIINSLYGTYKRIIFIKSINNLQCDELYNITMSVIKRVHSINLNVISITIDINALTKHLYGKMMTTDDDQQNYRIPNPCDTEKFIYLLYNPASIMQCIRNMWIDQGDPLKSLTYPNFDTGTMNTACFRHINELYESESDMLMRTASKLTHECIYPETNDRELIEYALNIFDMTTIVGLRTASSGYSQTVDLLNLLNSWWSIMDIRIKHTAMFSIYDGNLKLLECLMEWAKKWQLLNDKNCLDDYTINAMIQTSFVVLTLAKYMLCDLNIKIGFKPGKFHTEDMKTQFSKYKKYKLVRDI